MARKTKEESQKTRDLILDAAEYVFCEKGITHAAIADIAERAGVSRGAVYGHYKNKTEVALAVCNRTLQQPFPDDKQQEYDSPLQHLRVQYLNFLRGYRESGSLQRVLEILYCKCEESQENRPILDLKEFWEQRCREETMGLMKQAIHHGELPDNLGLGLACTYLDSLVNGLCSLILSSLSTRSSGWGNVEKVLDVGLDGLRFSPHVREEKAKE